MSRVGALANTVSQHTFQTTIRALKQGHALAMWIPGVAPLVSACLLPPTPQVPCSPTRLHLILGMPSLPAWAETSGVRTGGLSGAEG